MAENGADVGVEAFGAKVNVRNVKSLNTMLTGLTTVIVLVLAYIVFAHAADQKTGTQAIVQEIKESNISAARIVKDSNDNLIRALHEFSANSKEQTRVAREQNCLLLFDQSERQRQTENCKRISQ